MNWLNSIQLMDTSSTYVEGEKAELAEFGYSRGKRQDRKQINFGISAGMNNIPTALTIQRGHTQDKKYLRELLKLVSKVIPESSLLIFDAGANTKGNRRKIRDICYNYLTLKPKKVGTYKRYLHFFEEEF
jgi:transposase